MNSKIKDLMNQTGVPVSMPFDKWCEKFAGLIVRECCDLVREIDAMEIRKHFGVEE